MSTVKRSYVDIRCVQHSTHRECELCRRLIIIRSCFWLFSCLLMPRRRRLSMISRCAFSSSTRAFSWKPQSRLTILGRFLTSDIEGIPLWASSFIHLYGPCIPFHFCFNNRLISLDCSSDIFCLNSGIINTRRAALSNVKVSRSSPRFSVLA